MKSLNEKIQKLYSEVYENEIDRALAMICDGFKLLETAELKQNFYTFNRVVAERVDNEKEIEIRVKY